MVALLVVVSYISYRIPLSLSVADGPEYADWETYEDEELGFSLRYPAAWDIEKQLSSIDAQSWTWIGPTGEGSRLWIENGFNNEQLSLDAYVMQIEDAYREYDLEFEIEKETLSSGEPVYRITGLTDFYVPYVLYVVGNERQILLITSALNEVNLNAQRIEEVVGKEIPETPTRAKIISSLVVE